MKSRQMQCLYHKRLEPPETGEAPLVVGGKQQVVSGKWGPPADAVVVVGVGGEWQARTAHRHLWFILPETYSGHKPHTISETSWKISPFLTQPCFRSGLQTRLLKLYKLQLMPTTVKQVLQGL